MREWLGAREGPEAHLHARHRAEQRDRESQKRGKLETHNDISDFVHYVTRNRKDYEGRAAEFYWAELGTDFERVERDVRTVSMTPANKDKRIYIALGSELWLALNGSISKMQIRA